MKIQPIIYPRLATGSTVMIGKNTYKVHFIYPSRLFELTHLTNPYLSKTKTEQEIADLLNKNITEAKVSYWLSKNMIDKDKAEKLRTLIVTVLEDGISPAA